MRFLLRFLILTMILFSRKHKSAEKPLKWDQHKKLEFLVYGLPLPHETQNARYVIAKNWGFKDKNIAGCILTKALTDSVHQHNQLVKAALTAKFGSNWEAKFNKEVEQELVNEKKVIAILDQQKTIISKRKTLGKLGNELQFHIDPIDGKTIYRATVTGWKTLNGKDEYVSYYKYWVDLNSSKVKLISDSVRKL